MNEELTLDRVGTSHYLGTYEAKSELDFHTFKPMSSSSLPPPCCWQVDTEVLVAKFILYRQPRSKVELLMRRTCDRIESSIVWSHVELYSNRDRPTRSIFLFQKTDLHFDRRAQMSRVYCALNQLSLIRPLWSSTFNLSLRMSLIVRIIRSEGQL